MSPHNASLNKSMPVGMQLKSQQVALSKSRLYARSKDQASPGYPDILVGPKNVYVGVCYDNTSLCGILYRKFGLAILHRQFKLTPKLLSSFNMGANTCLKAGVIEC